MAEALLNVRDVLVHYANSTIVEVRHLSVIAGEVLALIGPNGAGKSTLLRVMGFLEKPTRGKVCFRGEEVTDRNVLGVRRRIATVFQEPLLLNASVYENAALGLKLRGIDRRTAERCVRPWLERFGIAHLAQRRARSLSGGEAQRTSLARALVLHPELLLLDEPFSALDAPTREALLIDLETILDQTGITTVFVTHDRNEAFMLADRVAVLIGGALLQIGTTDEVFVRPINEKVARFVGVDTHIAAVVEGAGKGRARVAFNGRRASITGDFQPGDRVILCLRPDDIALSLPHTEPVSSNSRNDLLVKVVKITNWGSHYRVVLDCDGARLIASVARSSFLELGLRVGDQVIASFAPSAVHAVKE